MSLGDKYALSWIEKNYESLGYTVTLRPSTETFSEALDVYKQAKYRYDGLIEVLDRYYGYRYRRMENFLRECKLWKPIGWGWVQEKVEVHIYDVRYESKQGLVHIEAVFEMYKPLHLVNMIKSRLLDFLEEILDQTNFYGIPILLSEEEVTVGYELKEDVYVYPEEAQDVRGTVTVIVKKKKEYTYTYVFEASVYNYYFFRWGMHEGMGFKVGSVSEA